jgi:hypothetical protein
LAPWLSTGGAANVAAMRLTGAVFPAGREEALKADFFRNTATGFFVDVGADAPQDGSQSFALERRGWSGVLVEPQPDFAGQRGASGAPGSTRSPAPPSRRPRLSPDQAHRDQQLVRPGRRAVPTRPEGACAVRAQISPRPAVPRAARQEAAVAQAVKSHKSSASPSSAIRTPLCRASSMRASMLGFMCVSITCRAAKSFSRCLIVSQRMWPESARSYS